MHKEICIKVNAFIDEGIAPVVEALSKIDNLVTCHSCQDLKGDGEALITFQYGSDYHNWYNLGVICEKISKFLDNIEYAEISVRWQTACCNFPEGFLRFKTADADSVASAISNSLIRD